MGNTSLLHDLLWIIAKESRNECLGVSQLSLSLCFTNRKTETNQCSAQLPKQQLQAAAAPRLLYLCYAWCFGNFHVDSRKQTSPCVTRPRSRRGPCAWISLKSSKAFSLLSASGETPATWVAITRPKMLPLSYLESNLPEGLYIDTGRTRSVAWEGWWSSVFSLRHSNFREIRINNAAFPLSMLWFDVQTESCCEEYTATYRPQ